MYNNYVWCFVFLILPITLATCSKEKKGDNDTIKATIRAEMAARKAEMAAQKAQEATQTAKDYSEKTGRLALSVQKLAEQSRA